LAEPSPVLNSIHAKPYNTGVPDHYSCCVVG